MAAAHKWSKFTNRCAQVYAALGELFYGVICREQSIQPAIGQLAGRQRQSSNVINMLQLAGTANPACYGAIYRQATLEQVYGVIYREQ